MKKKTVSYTSDNMPELTQAQIANLKALAEKPDSEIDFSDIPEATDEQWKHAVRGKFYVQRKSELTAQVDADVLAWLKEQGTDYQTRLNAILRREMLASKHG